MGADHRGWGSAVWVGYQAYQAESWAWVWWSTAVVLFTFGAVGLSLDGVPAERDERGRNLEQERKRGSQADSGT